MKMLLGVALSFLLIGSAFSQGIPTVTIDGKDYREITRVYLGAGGKVIIIVPGGGTATTADKLPEAFLKSWKISAESAKQAEDKKSADDLERAIRSGLFREIDGVVYDARKPQSGWVNIKNAKVIQVLEDGSIMVIGDVPIFVKGLSSTISDTDTLTFLARPNGNYSYINKRNDDRTIRAYEVGRACARSEIPEVVMTGEKPFEAITSLAKGNSPSTSKEVISSLPEGSELSATGSGFFITEDGYIITNFHVVEGAKKFKVRTSAGILAAKLIRTDKEHDLALLKSEGKFQPLTISKEDAQLGDSVFTIGFPNFRLQGTEPKYTDGKISSLAGIRDSATEYQISVPVQPGNSGGPLVDTSGVVRGVIVAQLDSMAGLRSSGSLPQNVNYAIKSKYIRELVNGLPEVMLVTPKTPIDSKAVIITAQRSVVMILVY